MCIWRNNINDNEIILMCNVLILMWIIIILILIM